MILHTEELRQKAHELALTHDPSHSRLPAYRLKRRLAAAVRQLRAFRDELRAAPAGCSQPAEEWLLDNAEFIQEQVLVVKQQLSGSFLRLLPVLRKSGEPRVLALCADYLEHVDSHLDEEALIAYINGYQEVAVLSLAEAWSFPLTLRIALLLRLADVMQLVRERREACLLVQRLLARLEPARLDPSRLKEALEEAGQDLPLSGPVIVHLIKQLREWADDSATVREWLVCKLENEPESLDKIVAYEYQLQASYQVITGNIISSLRTIARWDWRDAFERISLVERTLRQECTGTYPLLDFSSRDLLRKNIERLSRRLRVPENLVAKQAAELAAGQYEGTGPGRDEIPRRAFVAYYLQEEEGVRELVCALKTCSSPRSLQGISLLRHTTSFYLYVLAGLFLFFTLAFAAWAAQGKNFLWWQWLLVLLASVVPAGEWAVTFFHWLIECLRPAEPLLRYDFSAGIPDEAATMVVIPVIWSSAAEVQELVDRLELHYLANRDPNLHFALLGDFTDAGQEHLPGDEEVLAAARNGIEALNSSYSRPGGSTFHLFQRRRLWNPAEGVWMGWERKRGKLVEFTELLKGKKDTTFAHVAGDKEVLARIRYIITLDADTKLPLGTAQQMVGTIHLPYNRPRLNKSGTRVVEGYGVLQPRISISHDAAWRSRFVSLWSADPGIDPYAFAVSDPYQDGLGQGIFTGKGIFDVEAFVQVLNERIPENMVLSHDLLEGGFLRAALLSDIELIDDHPATFYAYQKRQHRWVRGDWQLLPWLFPRVRNRQGELQPVDLSPLTRWQIVDNLRRSLLLPGLLALLFAALTILPGSPGRWFTLAFVTLFLPVLRHLAALRWALRRPAGLLATAGQVLVTIITLPYQAAVMLDAVGRTLIRLFLTKRHLLEWVSAAEVERRSRGRKTPALQGMPAGYLLIFLFGLAALSQETAALLPSGLALSAAWFVAPLAVRWLDRPVREQEIPLAAAEEEEFTKLAREIWSFFQDFVTADNNWLPPDNVQLDPPRGVARRTSPTNMGLYLACALAARDLEFIDTPALITALERTISVVERLEKWHGHLYNWYNTETLEPLPPRYISTVDSGNFVSYLLAVKTGLAEWLASSHDTVGEEEKARGQELLARMERLIAATDFRPLYDHKTKLFALGYHGDLQKRDQILYDLLASEARQASFLALALGQVPAAHWHALGRSMTRVGRRVTLLSWSGTMFEYLMPSLLLRTYRNTVWESTYHAVVRRQIEYARQRGVPFGISESGYYAFDHQLNYQYRAFGVPGLGFKRDLEQDLVISPYAAILALPFARQEVAQALREMEALGGRGKYGFYEAIDFTAERLPRGRKHMVIRSFMAHHQGMSLLALANLLTPRKMYERFHRDKRVRAAELVLQERIPAHPRIIKHPALARVHLPYQEQAGTGPYREFSTADTAAPEVCVLANGSLMTAITAGGSGFSHYRGLAVSRWREDPVLDNWGSYIYLRDVNRNTVWSPTYQPCRVPPAKQRIQFSLDRATFMREDGELKTTLEVCVSPEWDAEVRRLTLANTGDEPHIIEVTTFQEPVLAAPLADESHPAFSKLFLETAYEEKTGCLLARRRPRQETEQEIWAAHSLIATGNTLGPVEYETDRACFIGRGYTLARPRGITARLRGKTGSVADPAFIMRRRIKIEPGEQVQLFAVTAVGGTKEDVTNIISHFTYDQAVERTFQMAWNRSQIELRHLHLTGDEAMVFQAMAGRILYTPPFKEQREASIRHNVKGQSGLWAFGISGDLPLILVRIDHRAGLPFAVRLITGHEYLNRLGLAFDLVILNESAAGYQQDLQETLRRAVGHRLGSHGTAAGGIFIINAGQLPEEDRTLLLAASRLILQADGPSLRAQLKLPLHSVYTAPPATAEAAAESESPPAVEMPDLLFFNGWGGFTPDGREYRIVLKNGNHLPAPWVNVLANNSFGCLVTELGTGYTWWRNSRECKLTPWSNDPILDPPGEISLLRDEANGAFWSPVPLTFAKETHYTVSHGFGYTRFAHERNGIATTMTVCVPPKDAVKIISLQLENKSDIERQLTVTYYAEWVLGVRRQQSAPYIITEWQEADRMLVARNMAQETFRTATAFLAICPPPAAPLSWTADRKEFFGRNGTWEHPAAMQQEHLSGRTGALADSCGVVQARLTLPPHSAETVIILLGCAESTDAAAELVQYYSHAGNCEQELADIHSLWDSILNQIQVSTPCREMDMLLNGWLLYQTLCCRLWARTGFYQAGGAYGYRDQLQDVLALLHTRPDLARAQILLHAAHQYTEGDVQHWWHEETARGIRTRFSDDLLWLPYTVARYVEQTGDESVLDEVVPYLQSEPLAEDVHERYEPTELSAESGTVFEHCLRALERALAHTGEHGLPLIGSGDWNDGFSLVGPRGRGESVWLGWFLCTILPLFSELCDRRGDGERAGRYREAREQLAAAIDKHGWDEQWYRRAFTDAGKWLGSVHSEECRIDAIAQSWSVLSGAAPQEKALQAMQSFDRELVDHELGIARLLTPPFNHTTPSPGYIQGYPPGIRENGGQYTHGVIWSIIAWCILGNGDKAFELFHLLNPLTHTRTAAEVRQYAGEPYVMAADVYTAAPHEGRAGWTWYTGAAGWMYQAGIEWILGLRRRGNLLFLRPCLPSDWPGFSATYRFGGASYLLTVTNTQGAEATRLELDGVEITPAGQGPESCPCIELQDDGQEHHVNLII